MATTSMLHTGPDSTIPDGDTRDTRDETAFVGAMRHSRRVRLFKVALPTIAVTMAAAFIGYSYLFSPSSVGIEIDGSAIRDGKLIMANPKMSGFTKDNLPYAMNAVRAIQDLSRTGEIALEEIDAKFPIASDKWALVKASNGVYDDNANTLQINSPVTFATSDGMTAQLRSAHIDIGAGEMHTPDPVDIRQDGSRITADSLSVQERGKVFVFENRVRMQIDPKNVRTADAGGAGGE